MITKNTNRKFFCIIDYFIDGKYLKWEEVLGNCPILTKGETISISLENGKKVCGTVVETKLISDSEKQVYLISACK